MDMAKTVETERAVGSAMLIENGRHVRRGRIEMSPENQEAVRSVLRDLQALPKGTTLTLEEVAAFVHRLPGRPANWTSADVIREARGPLPEAHSDVAE
jgi:hypothetical protein